MASEIDQLIKVYAGHVAVPWHGSLSGEEKVWFLVYRPENERRVMFRLEDIESATREAKHGWVRIDLAHRYSRWLARHRNKARYLSNLGAADLSERFALDLIDELAPEVAAAGPDDVVILTSTIALFGVAKLSELIKGVNAKRGLEAHVKGRLLVLFPGSHENNIYRFLEAGDGWSYRAVPLTASSAVV